MSVLADIDHVYFELYEKEKKVADYVLKHFSQVIDMSVMELAQKSEVSEATIMRFCKKAGFKGFYHFKISLIKDMSSMEKSQSDEIAMDDIEKSIHKIFLYKVEELQQCDKMIDYNIVKVCIEKISKCNLLYIFGAGNTNPVALYAAYQFSQYGIRTIVNQAPEMQINSAFGLKEDDVSIIISNSGITNMIVDIAEIAKSRNSTIIAITSFPKSHLASIADHVLISTSSDKILFDIYNTTRMCHMAIVDLLLILLSRCNDKKFYRTGTEREEFFSKFKL